MYRLPHSTKSATARALCSVLFFNGCTSRSADSYAPPSTVPLATADRSVPTSAESRAVPTISEEFGFDIPVQIPPLDDQRLSATAWDGSRYLTVWADIRARYSSYSSDIYGAFVTPDSTATSPSNFVISAFPNDQTSPAVAYNGAVFLVVWQDTRNEEESNTRSDIYGARVTPEGEVLDPQGIQLSTRTTITRSPVVASDGVDFLVLWEDLAESGNQSFEAYGTRVSGDGVVMDPGGIPISTAVGAQTPEGLTFGGDHYLAVWSDSRNGLSETDIIAARISRDGAVLDPSGIPISEAEGRQLNPSAASGDDFHLVCYTATAAAGGGRINCRKLNFDGSPADDTPLVPDSVNTDQRYSEIAFDGTHFFIVWTGNGEAVPSRRELYGVRVGATADAVDEAVENLRGGDTDVEFPKIACGSADCIAVWNEQGAPYNYGGDNILGQLLDKTMAPEWTVPALLSTSANNQDLIDATFNGTVYFTVWRDDRNYLEDDYQIYGARVTAAGEVLDPNGISISNGAVNPKDPRVATDGTDFVVVWADQRSTEENAREDIYAARVGSDGTLLDAQGILIAAGQGEQVRPDVAYGGGAYQFVWQDAGESNINGWADIYGARLSSQGELVTAPYAVTNDDTREAMPLLAFNGTNFLLVWSAQQLFAALLSESGEMVNEPFRVSPTDSFQAYATVTSDGTDFLTAWTDYRASSPELMDIWFNLVRGDGTVDLEAETVLTPFESDQQIPTAVFDGEQYWVAWQDARIESSVDRDIFGARVSRAGTVLDKTAFDLSVTEYSQEEYPVLASNGAGQSLLVYSRFTTLPDRHSNRARARFITFSDALSCTDASQCETEFCVDGVCCTEACGDGDPFDCMACSIRAGGSADGICSPVTKDSVCREAAMQCDREERCDGTATDCPADEYRSTGDPCNDADPQTEGDICRDDGSCAGETVADSDPIPDAGVDTEPLIPDAGIDTDTAQLFDTETETETESETDNDTDTGVPDAGAPTTAAQDSCGCRAPGRRPKGGAIWLIIQLLEKGLF